MSCTVENFSHGVEYAVAPETRIWRSSSSNLVECMQIDAILFL